MVVETKRCRDCGEEKPLGDFSIYCAKGKTPRPYSYCKRCVCRKTKCYHEKNPEAAKNRSAKWYADNKATAKRASRAHKLKRNFGLTRTQYDEMLAAQRGLCAICLQDGGGEHLCVDHCHSTGRIRGLLCKKCNMGLGNFKDNPESIERAVSYLRRSLN